MDENEKPMTLLLKQDLLEWLTARAKENGRARLREAEAILIAEKKREARNLANPLNAQA